MINSLFYADDMVIFYDKIKELQRMINNLKDYCERWNLVINTSKFKIIIFRRGGHLAGSERWHYGEEIIEVVNGY